MKKCIGTGALASLAVLLFAHGVWAGPTLIYQGHLSGENGSVNASYAMTFRLYADRDGADALWTESYESVDVVDGTFNVELGSETAFGDLAASGADMYLGVTVADGAEMTPRMKVGTVLRAQWAAHAQDVRGEDIHPRTVSIGDTQVIDSDGQWIGSPVGLRGPEGPQGPKGDSGERGPAGDVGPRGDAGARGQEGPQGPEGPRGLQGARGPEGPQGIEGLRGPAGTSFNVLQDRDADGFVDWIELMVDTDPTDEASVPADLNADGIPDILRGPSGFDGDEGPKGADGVSIVEATVNGAGELLLARSVGDPLNVGTVVGATIDTAVVADDGVMKLHMTDGRVLTVDGTARGPRGEPGASVTGGTVSELGILSLTLSEGTTIEVGAVRGQQGLPGVGINDAAIDADGDLLLTMTDGQTINAGTARGEDGRNAENESPLTRIFAEQPRRQGEPVDIPRALTDGASVSLDIDYNGVITSIAIVVDITHPDTRELVLRLDAPNGTSYTLFEGSEGVNLTTVFPDELASADNLDDLLGEPAAGTWTLHAIDSDNNNPQAQRRINGFGLNLERQADDAWRLPTNLVVEGRVEAETLCKIQPLMVNGQEVSGAVTLTCGSQPPIRLSTFQCGNTKIDPGETCDDGNFATGDGCDDRCLLECGNGALDNNEECDDGNRIDTDACTAACRNAICGDGIVRFGSEECDLAAANSNAPGAECRSDCTSLRCGDGINDPGEECDDGNDSDTDSCTTLCTDATCGDGHLQGTETCDRGDANSNAPGAECRLDCTSARCGDEVTDPGEECDAGTENSDDANAVCRSDCSLPSCGDGIVDTNLGEECDDGNTDDDDGCPAGCAFPVTFTNCGQTGREGPSQADCDTAYDSTNLNGLVTVSGGIQRWRVPATGKFNIEVRGARGGNPGQDGSRFGKGARLSSNFDLVAGESIYLLVGQMGSIGLAADHYNASGGGGTFVYRDVNAPAPLMVAGGGGGGSYDTSLNERMHASLGPVGQSGVNSNGGVGANGGVNGGGGSGGTYDYRAGAGGGWSSNGTGGHNQCNYSVTPGEAPRNGGRGGQGGNENGGGSNYPGGFGGGGGGTGACNSSGGGGGGGYGGGGVGNDCCSSQGGGGGSYSQEPQLTSAVDSTSHGQVVIRRIQ